jgi:hypothetical protein
MILLWTTATATASEPCYGWTLPNHVEGAHVSIEWDDLIDAARAEQYATVADQAWDTYLSWGFPAPVGAPSLTFAVDTLDRAGFTDTRRCDGDGLNHPRIFVFAPVVPGYADVTVAHELFHAVEYAYQPDVDFLGNIGIWPWWAEGTAVWAALRLGTEPAWSNWNLSGFIDAPHLALHQDATAFLVPERSRHMYGTGLLAVHLEDVAGPAAIAATFDAVRGTAGQPAWFPDVIEATGLDWDELWRGFLARLPTLDLPMDLAGLDKPEPASIHGVLSAEGAADPEALPQGLGYAIHRFAPEAGAPGGTLAIRFDGQPGPRWHAVLVTTEGNRTGAPVVARVDLDVGSDGAGEGQIEFDGDRPAFLVVSPEHASDRGWTYTWSAVLLARSDLPLGPSPAGCTCHSHARFGGWTVALAMLTISRRRGSRHSPVQCSSIALRWHR